MATHVIRTTRERVGAQVAAKPAAVREIMREAALEACLRTLPRVVRDSPVDQGFFRASWGVSRDVRGLGDEILAELRNDAPHAGILELGARPGFYPPFQPIFEWAQRKAGDLSLGGVVQIGAGSFRTGRGGRQIFRGRASLGEDDLEELRRFAWAVVNAIHRRGLPARRIMGRNMPFLRSAFGQEFRRRLRDLAGRP